MTTRSDLLRQRLKQLGIGLVRTTGTQYVNSCWLLEKPEPGLKQPWHMAARNLNDVERIVAHVERETARSHHRPHTPQVQEPRS